MNDPDWWVSPVDKHRHALRRGRSPDECPVCALEAENERLRAVVEAARQASNDLERLRAQQMVIAYPVSVRALRDGLAAFDQQEAT